MTGRAARSVGGGPRSPGFGCRGVLTNGRTATSATSSVSAESSPAKRANTASRSARRPTRTSAPGRRPGTGPGRGDRGPRLETAIYKASGLKILAKASEAASSSPPFLGVAPTLEVYRERGHRRLSATTYNTKCQACLWGCEMAVEMTIDQWNPSNVRYRRETFCYGPMSCAFYKAGPTRKVPGRSGMSWEEKVSGGR